MAGVMGAAWRLLRLDGEAPITRQMLRLIGKDFTLDISKAETELGYAPVLTPEDGFRMMARPVSRPNNGCLIALPCRNRFGSHRSPVAENVPSNAGMLPCGIGLATIP
jgi:hypothetical protein